MKNNLEWIQLDNTLTAAEKSAIDELKWADCIQHLALILKENTVDVIDGGQTIQMNFEQITEEINHRYIQKSPGNWKVKVDTNKWVAPQWIQDIVTNPRNNDFAYFLQVCANTLGHKIDKAYGNTAGQMVDVTIDSIFGNQTRQISEQFGEWWLDKFIQKNEITLEYDEEFGYIIGKDKEGKVRYKAIPSWFDESHIYGENPCFDKLSQWYIPEAINTINLLMNAGIKAGIFDSTDKAKTNDLMRSAAANTADANKMLDLLAADPELNKLFHKWWMDTTKNLSDLQLDEVQYQVATFFHTNYNKETRNEIRNFVATEKMDEWAQIPASDMKWLESDFVNGTSIVTKKYDWIDDDMIANYNKKKEKALSNVTEQSLRQAMRVWIIESSNGKYTDQSPELNDLVNNAYPKQRGFVEESVKKDLLYSTLMTWFMEKNRTSTKIWWKVTFAPILWVAALIGTGRTFDGDRSSLSGVYADSAWVWHRNLSDENSDTAKMLAKEAAIMAIATVATMWVWAVVWPVVRWANAAVKATRLVSVWRTLLQAWVLGTTFYSADIAMRSAIDGTSFTKNWKASEAARTSAMFLAFGMMKHMKWISKTIGIGNKTIPNPLRLLDLASPKTSRWKVAKEIFVWGNIIFGMESGMEVMLDGKSFGEAMTREEYVQAMLMMWAMKWVEIGSNKLIKVFRDSGKVKLKIIEKPIEQQLTIWDKYSYTRKTDGKLIEWVIKGFGQANGNKQVHLVSSGQSIKNSQYALTPKQLLNKPNIKISRSGKVVKLNPSTWWSVGSWWKAA